MPAIGGIPSGAKVSASGRQGLRGGFAVLSLALKFAFPGNRRRGLQSVGSRFLLTARKAKHPVLLEPFGRQVSEANNAHAVDDHGLSMPDAGADKIGPFLGIQLCGNRGRADKVAEHDVR
jgi:hypothetical protein